MNARSAVRFEGGSPVQIADGEDKYTASVAAPILSEGDVMGCVLFASADSAPGGELEFKLAQTVAAFLGKQMES